MTILHVEKNVKLCSRICAVLMLAVILCQFLPWWHYGEGQSASIAAYVWFPTNMPDLNTHLTGLDETHYINNLAFYSVITMLGCAGGIILCLLKPASALRCLIPGAVGLFGLVQLLQHPVLREGYGWLLLALNLLLILVGGAALALRRWSVKTAQA